MMESLTAWMAGMRVIVNVRLYCKCLASLLVLNVRSLFSSCDCPVSGRDVPMWGWTVCEAREDL